MNFGYIHNIIIQRNGGSDFRPMGLISVSGGLISGTIGLKPDHVDQKSDLGGLTSGRTEISILLIIVQSLSSVVNFRGSELKL